MGQLISSSKFVNGKLHWDTNVGSGLERVWGKTSFDLGDNKWGKVERPRGDGVLMLGVLGTNISMICNYLANHIDVWTMKEYGDKQSWIKMKTINYSFLHPIECLLFQSFYMSKRGEFSLMFKIAYMIYNQKDNSIRYLHLHKLNYGVLADFYIQSFVYPLSQNEPRT
ncbi:hypothetical protein R3W88_000759 [Solanum pinnatisectum]|uniref:Uncharacterized protein n=1 Tax=Solanum pinnatisectum TaxID=50273 RepID=A0AAV9MGA0_9SOLN|nr:hypothetical protein R3W88_000759 [Solanum pinnatisectum]